MLIIPVIDLMGGRVVHARRGDRSNYRPLQTVLTASSEALDVVAALLDLAAFRAIYVADLDAILGCGDHSESIERIERTFEPLTLWLDAGFGTPADIARFESKRAVPVIGSESLPSLAACADLLRAVPDAILSLDTRAGVPLGPTALFDAPEHWPQRVIVMTLDRVGGGQGPALERLQATLALAAGKQVIAAGGVRNAADLDTLAQMGVYAVLVASAIHDGTLDRATLGRFLKR